jgi:hypothetical protein
MKTMRGSTTNFDLSNHSAVLSLFQYTETALFKKSNAPNCQQHNNLFLK